MPISPEILPVLAIFLNAFTAPIWEKRRLLLCEPCSHAADALSLRPCVRREAVRISTVVDPKNWTVFEVHYTSLQFGERGSCTRAIAL